MGLCRQAQGLFDHGPVFSQLLRVGPGRPRLQRQEDRVGGSEQQDAVAEAQGPKRRRVQDGHPPDRGRNAAARLAGARLLALALFDLIALAHEIPYVATATVAELHDLEAKVRRAMEIRGPRYLHVLVPCPLGWGSEPAETILIARLAKESGLFPVFEAIDGRIASVAKIRRQVPVGEYLRRQRRYAHLFADGGREDVIARLQALADANIARFGLQEGTPPAPGELLETLTSTEKAR